MLALRVDLRRHNLIWWHWRLTLVDERTSAERPIAEGANLTRKQAQNSAMVWYRLYLRRYEIT